MSQNYLLKHLKTIPVDVLGKGLGKVFVITIQAAPRSLLTNCIPQGPFFSLQKPIQPSEPLSMRTLQKSIWTTQCQENIRFWTIFFNLIFVASFFCYFLVAVHGFHHLKLLFVASFFFHCSGLFLCRRECLHLVLIKPELVFSSFFSAIFPHAA